MKTASPQSNNRARRIYAPLRNAGAYLLLVCLVVVMACPGVSAQDTGHAINNLIPTQGQESIVRSYLDKAQDSFDEGEYYEAIKLWRDVLYYEPDNKTAAEGIRLAGKKIDKIKDFFGKDVFEAEEVNTFSLHECLEIAKESSLLFSVAEEQIELAKIKLWQARRSFLPSMELSWIETKGITADGKIKGKEYGVASKQPAFHSGELIHTLGQAKVNLDIAQKNYDAVEIELYLEVAEAYYELVKAKNLLNFMRALNEEVQQVYDMVKQQNERELVSRIDFLDAEAKYNQIYYEGISVENDYEIAKLELEQKLNIERSGAIDVSVDLPDVHVDKDMDTCLFIAIENRPDLKMDELTLQSAELGTKIAQAKELPSVDLSGHYKRSSEVYKDIDSLNLHRKWYAGVEVKWPFFGSTGQYSLYKREDPATLSTYHGGTESKGTSWKFNILDNMKQFSDSQEAEIAFIRAEEELNEARKEVVKEVKEAFYTYQKARIQLQSAEVQKEFNEKQLNILRVKHAHGEVDIGALLDNFVNILEANEDFFEAQRLLYTSVAGLNKAMGLSYYF